MSGRAEAYLLDHQVGRERLIDYLRAFQDIPGWFELEDLLLFQKIDAMQLRKGIKGDLLEVGVYLGKSAILLGYLRRDGEHLVVCDLFETVTPLTPNNRIENAVYQGCSRQTFERNYLMFHSELPVILACSSTDVGLHAPSRPFRFVHIDGSHLYEIVRADIQTAKKFLSPGGVVAFDDFQNPLTPGVTAAVIEEVLHGGLRPLCFTSKLYGTWDAGTVEDVAELSRWATEHPLLQATTHVIFGRELVHVAIRRPTRSRLGTFVSLLMPPGLVMLGDLLRRRVASWAHPH